MQTSCILSCCNSFAHPFTHLSRFLYLLLFKREQNTSVISSNKYTAVSETSALAMGSNKEYSNETGCCYIDGKGICSKQRFLKRKKKLKYSSFCHSPKFFPSTSFLPLLTYFISFTVVSLIMPSICHYHYYHKLCGYK